MNHRYGWANRLVSSFRGGLGNDESEERCSVGEIICLQVQINIFVILELVHF